LDGDGEIVAHVESLSFTDPWAKAGVMIREDIAADSPHAMMIISAGNGSGFQRRTQRSGFSEHTPGDFVSVPYWVRLVREGSTLRGFISDVGDTWIEVGSATIEMAQKVYIGLAVTAHNNSQIAEAVFDSVNAIGGVQGFEAKINFQATGTTTPPDYFADEGAVFGDRGSGVSYGWNMDNAENMRERNAARLRLRRQANESGTPMKP